MALDLQCTPTDLQPLSFTVEVTTHEVPVGQYVRLLISLTPGGVPIYTSPNRPGDGALAKEELFAVAGLQGSTDYWVRAVWFDASGGAEVEISNECKITTRAAAPLIGISKVTSEGDGTGALPQTFISTVIVSNMGTAAFTGDFTDLVPAQPPGTKRTYSSSAQGGASGNTASGHGHIEDELTLPVGTSVTYTIAEGVHAPGPYENIAVVAGLPPVSGGIRWGADIHPPATSGTIKAPGSGCGNYRPLRFTSGC